MQSDPRDTFVTPSLHIEGMTSPPHLPRPADRITLLPEFRSLSMSQFTEGQPAVACDCYVEEIERSAERVAWGWRFGPHENIDHHAPVSHMARPISSTNLALVRVEACGPVHPNTAVLITHTDADSILSAGIVSGLLPPRAAYGRAAIAADHTGAPDPIADLLQALDPLRSVVDSFNALAILEDGGPLPSWAATRLAARQQLRETMAAAVPRFRMQDGVAWMAFEHEVAGEFLPHLLPEAQVIVVGYPMADRASRWTIKVRLGQAAPDGLTLDALRLHEIDPAYGGRWNAGATKRGGGSELGPAAWAARLSR
jgi:hypothetical protein